MHFSRSSLRHALRILGALFFSSVIPVAHSKAASRFENTTFGMLPDSGKAQIFTLRNTHGVTVRFTSYGGIITAIETPDKKGTRADIVLGFSDLKGYVVDSAKGGLFFGALIGRYANRIAGGTYILNGVEHHVAITAPPNSLHGGLLGFDKKLWKVRRLDGLSHASGAELTLVSPDGEEGFPGKLTVHVDYILDDSDRLTLHYHATTDKPTILNLTNHSYFNLGGEGSGSIERQVLTINADHYTPTDSTSIPTGEITPVANTPFDFLTPHVIGERLRSNDQQMMYARGYDHNWVINGEYGKSPRLAAHLTDPATGRTLTVFTSQPGLQVYTSNSLDGTYAGPSGRSYRQTDAIAFEAEHFPDSPNHPNFPTTTLQPGEIFDYTTVFQFGVTQ
ncbi:aldose epimerase family protein [Acetobacter fallax]|uniref:Aldose 1-epimerase n=1 Tax=Acetobacter fallax TaxID=1737473 RepID=A0ABX0KBR0_9PROT|nr:aldose epimerase family protein [Acetobacter fallax]NHO32879.1 galactose-1-epimerase [Acetobacter fallax]NHO36441.1 galactose-1-epimerase [Acetobacter fallax]